MNKEKINIAFIGNGKSTNRYHIPFIQKLKDQFNIKKIWERSDKSKEWSRIDGVEYTKDLEDIFNDESINTIVVTTPPKAHYEMAKRALEAGKNVIVEKPFTLDIKEAEELFNIADEKGLIIQAYQNRRFDSDFLTVIKVIESGVLGDIYEIESNYDFYRPEVPKSFKEFKKEETFLYTHACHTVDQILSYFGEPQDIKYDIKALLGPGKMNDYFDIDLFYENLKVSVRSSYFRLKSRPRFIVYGTNGVFVKETVDKQEADLKKFYMPTNSDFGRDLPDDYGIVTYLDENGDFHEEKVISEIGDYSKFYQKYYNTVTSNATPLVKKGETLLQLDLLESALENFK